MSEEDWMALSNSGEANIIFDHNGAEIKAFDTAKRKLTSLVNVRFHPTHCINHVGIIWNKGHKELCQIAMRIDLGANDRSILAGIDLDAISQL